MVVSKVHWPVVIGLPLLIGSPILPLVTFGFQRNPDVAGNRRSGVRKHVWLIAIDYHTVAGTAGTECKGDQRSKRARQSESRTDSDGLTETQGQGT